MNNFQEKKSILSTFFSCYYKSHSFNRHKRQDLANYRIIIIILFTTDFSSISHAYYGFYNNIKETIIGSRSSLRQISKKKVIISIKLSINAIAFFISLYFHLLSFIIIIIYSNFFYVTNALTWPSTACCYDISVDRCVLYSKENVLNLMRIILTWKELVVDGWKTFIVRQN